MNNKFDVYKWRREQLNENESNLESKANKVYSTIEKYLKEDHDKRAIIRRLMDTLQGMNESTINEEKISPNQLFNDFKQITVKGAGTHYPNEKLIKVTQRYAPEDNDAEKFFAEKGYTVEIKYIDGEPGETLDQVEYRYN
jgi:DNA repair exonuclease SbcCD ATPase subunit